MAQYVQCGRCFFHATVANRRANAGDELAKRRLVGLKRHGVKLFDGFRKVYNGCHGLSDCARFTDYVMFIKTKTRRFVKNFE